MPWRDDGGPRSAVSVICSSDLLSYDWAIFNPTQLTRNQQVLIARGNCAIAT